ncbi:MAG: (2,3-dihydroxybenzoyl)adenylate synthase [Okeania sp. SIO3B3]|nr:(2,3-dihydroxybenzoyl)adenylate synthase [Okeania sp. SIO3B3]
MTNGRLLIPSIELSLGLWQGNYSEIERLWLRWMSMEGDLILISEEEVVAAQQQATSAEERADRLAAKLRELGIDPDELS